MSEDEICRRGRAGLADPSDPRWAAGVEERARTGRFFGELSMLRGDQSAFTVELSSAVFETKPSELRTVIVMRDVSNRAIAEHTNEMWWCDTTPSTVEPPVPLTLLANPITAAEQKVLRYLPTNLNYREIAEQLHLSRHTVKSHTLSIYRKLGVDSRTAAVQAARKLRLLTRSAAPPKTKPAAEQPANA
jgi:ATP/maltotriose-dependent transcriptional regulator MalT